MNQENTFIDVDARGARRQQTMFVVGRVASSFGEIVCLVRNISSSGIGIEHSNQMAVGQVVTIETRCLLPARAIVRWATATHAGLEFLEPARMMSCARSLEWPRDRVLRSPRFALDRDVQLMVGNDILSARATDIALGGLKLVDLEAPTRPAPARVTLTTTGTSLFGRIRWNRAAIAGFQFVMPLTSRELAALLAKAEVQGP